MSLSQKNIRKRVNVDVMRNVLEDEIINFYDREMERCDKIRDKTNATAVDIYEKLLSKIRWANPFINSSYRNIIIQYCEHLLVNNPSVCFRNINVLNSWNDKVKGTDCEKVSLEIQQLYTKIYKFVIQRENKISSAKSNLMANAEKMIIKKEAKLRWAAELNPGKRDEYWTVWFLASKGLLAELTRLVENDAFTDIDIRDPDFNYTALHYASKRKNANIVKYLISKNANVNASIDDGRTPLHLAAQYSTKEVVSELLIAGAAYDSLDRYGCTPLDLANQNQNGSVLSYLRNWPLLLPPLEPVEEASDPPSSAATTSPKCQWSPAIVMSAMSQPLQCLATRLDCKDRKLCPFVEMRLCEKHSSLCFKEGFIAEAMKSFRRRWKTAQQLLEAPPSQPRLGIHAVVGIGLSLCEALVEQRAEGGALTVLRECMELPHALDDALLLAVHSRAAQLSLSCFDQAARMGTWDAAAREALLRRISTPLKESFLPPLSPADNRSEAQNASTLAELKASLLAQGIASSTKAIEAHSSQHRDEVPSEQPSLIPLLQLQAELLERCDDYAAAIQCLERAVSVGERSLGCYDPLTMAALLDRLRLRLKTAQQGDGIALSRFASEVSRRLDHMAADNETEVSAEALRKKYVEVISISCVHSHLDKEKGHPRIKGVAAKPKTASALNARLPH